MLRARPPFRADHVGSLLRPLALKAARERHERGEIDAAQLKAVEDEEVRRAIRKQEEIGLAPITDGELRRAYWHFDFLQHLIGCEGYWMEPATEITRARTAFQARRSSRGQCG
jgi:5-methyltetrahydropteroyltriglutamate--homocysteine methyltransferase